MNVLLIAAVAGLLLVVLHGKPEDPSLCRVLRAASEVDLYHEDNNEDPDSIESKIPEVQRRAQLLLEREKSRDVVEYMPHAPYVTTGFGAPL